MKTTFHIVDFTRNKHLKHRFKFENEERVVNIEYSQYLFLQLDINLHDNDQMMKLHMQVMIAALDWCSKNGKGKLIDRIVVYLSEFSHLLFEYHFENSEEVAKHFIESNQTTFQAEDNHGYRTPFVEVEI